MGAFKYLKDRVWNRVQGWMEQCVSASGKEVLIKEIAKLFRPSQCRALTYSRVYSSTWTACCTNSSGGVKPGNERRAG